MVNVAKNAGFCAGVKHAVDMALELAEKYGKIYTIGQVVHNELVTKYLKEHGADVVELTALDTLKPGDVVLIRAHGLDKNLEQKLVDRGIKLFDATCPVVKKNQKIVEEESNKGNDIIIVGDKDHDEVLGLMSYAKNPIVYKESYKIEFPSKPTSVVFQTTITAEKMEEIDEYLNKLNKSQNLVVTFNTICYTTKKRQEETAELAKTNDAIIVLGSKNSANTIRLYEVAKKINQNSYFFQTIEDVKSNLNYLKDYKKVSIVAGASTPPWLIQEVNKVMSTTQKDAKLAQETEMTKEATSQEQTKEDKELTMEDLLKSNKSMGFMVYKPGKRIKGTVISATESGVFVAIDGKKDGFIDKADACLDGAYNPADFVPGAEIQAIIVAVNKDFVSLSKKEVDAKLVEEEEAEKALSAGEFELVMTEVVKGGLRGRLGKYTIFVPASQIKVGFVNNLEDYKGKKLRLMIMPPKDAKEGEEGEEKKNSRYLFASQRMILEKEKKEKEDAFWNNIHVKDIVEGKVKRFTQFGAFVSVRGFDCLAHVSELSWNKITDPSKVLNVNETYEFVVLKVERETGKISLGYKQLQKKPYEIAAEKYPIGTVVKGKVERIFPYGAFISIDDGVDGLVHVSQISHNWIKDANEALKVGQEVEAKIISFDDENRITLSIKELLPEPVVEEAPAEAAEGEEKAEEKPAKKSSRAKKFEEKVENAKPKRGAKKEEKTEEPKSWVSGSSSTNVLAEKLKALVAETAEEEKPAKKKASKKDAE